MRKQKICSECKNKTNKHAIGCRIAFEKIIDEWMKGFKKSKVTL